MLHSFTSDNCLTAWRDACRFIIDNGDGTNLIVGIDQPANYVHSQLSEIIQSGIISLKDLHDVANTIFPNKCFARNSNLSLDQFYQLHEELYKRGKSMHGKNKSRWGNYFLRFTRFGSNRKNQLQNIIDDIRRRPKKYAACYIMHVSSVDLDSNTRTIGNPCLQYVQFEQANGTLNLTAVYRNHDFFAKALGNYIGLSGLLEFVCGQTNHGVGSLTSHSIHYYLPHKRRVDTCLQTLTW